MKSMERSRCEAAKYVLERFEHYGTNVSVRSRFMRMYEAVCNDDGSPRGFIPETDPGFGQALEALRDFRLLEFFFDQIAADTDKNKYADVIGRIPKDSVFPQNDKTSSPGRDAQAEVFAFAVCRNAGMNPVFQEPDVVCEIGQERFGIAVKRAKARPQLEKRLAKAAKQIQRWGLPGIISLDVTLAVNPKNYSIMTTEGEKAITRWWTDKMRKTVDQCDGKIWQKAQDNGVLGVFFHEHCPVRINGSYVLRTMTYGIETAGSDKKTLWLEFKTRFVGGLPNLQV